jgi:hypothetical protein
MIVVISMVMGTRLVMVVLGVVAVAVLFLERDRAIDLRLAEHFCEAEGQESRDHADQHAAQEQLPHHVANL